jgi:glycosyl transferase family 25
MKFPPILVINLDDRPDRWSEIQKEFEGWPSLERISAVKESPGWKGCNKSHLKAIKEAKKRNYPWVLVLEDDCIVNPDSLSRFNELLPSLWTIKNEYDVFLGGATFIKDVSIIQYSPPLFKMKGYTTHFCLYPSSSYDKLIDVISNGNVVIDVLFRDGPSIRLICTSPHIATQRAGKSDITNQEGDYSPAFSKSTTVLSQFMHSEKSLEGFIQESTVYNKKVTIMNILIILGVFVYAKYLITA